MTCFFVDTRRSEGALEDGPPWPCDALPLLRASDKHAYSYDLVSGRRSVGLRMLRLLPRIIHLFAHTPVHLF